MFFVGRSAGNSSFPSIAVKFRGTSQKGTNAIYMLIMEFPNQFQYLVLEPGSSLQLSSLHILCIDTCAAYDTSTR